MRAAANHEQKARQLLQHYWGAAQFRPLQWEAINHTLSGKDTLVLFPTGGGKSLCYQLPALLLDGMALVISPLISLMQDQVAALREKGIKAEALVGGVHPATTKRIMMNAVNGAYRLLYVSPERLQSRWFLEHLRAMPISMVAVDEAHCISTWGHDFRPDYYRIAELKDILAPVPFMALTATATEKVLTDITQSLKLSQPLLLRQSFERKNIQLQVRYPPHKWQALLETLQHTAGSAIVYCGSRRTVTQLALALNKEGIPAAAYHAGMDKAKREAAFQNWMQAGARVMVATNAFGMGIDKHDVRLVLHYDVPESPEAYYQEAGRAGRDGQPALAMLLWQQADLRKMADNLAAQYPPTAFLRQTYQAVCEYLQIPIGNEPYQYFPFDFTQFTKNFQLPAKQAHHALRLLEREGLWTLCDTFFEAETVHFLVDRQVIDSLRDAHPRLYLLATHLLRQYGHAYLHPAPISSFLLARKMQVAKEEITRMLRQLEQMEIIAWQQPLKTPQLFFHHRRADSRYLIMDEKRMALLRQESKTRMAAMEAYLKAETACRNALLLDYFGEKAPLQCGHCDNCRKKDGRPDKRQTAAGIWDILKASEGIALRELCLQLPHLPADAITSQIRTWADEGKVTINRQQLIRLV